MVVSESWKAYDTQYRIIREAGITDILLQRGCFRGTQSFISVDFCWDGFKRAVSPIFSVTLNGEKTYLYRWEHQNNGSILLKITLLGPRNYINHFCFQMARMEMDCNLKKLVIYSVPL